MRVNVRFYFMYMIIILFLNRCNTGRELIIQCVYTFESFDVLKKQNVQNIGTQGVVGCVRIAVIIFVVRRMPITRMYVWDFILYSNIRPTLNY